MRHCFPKWFRFCLLICVITLPAKLLAQSPLQNFIAQLIEAPSDEAARTLLSANPNLVNQELPKALIERGMAVREKNRAQARIAFQRAAEIAEKMNARETTATGYFHLGNVISAQRDYELALTYLLKSLAICRTLPDQLQLSKTLNNVAATYQNLGRYTESLTAYEESLKIKQQLLAANNSDPELKKTTANSLVGLGRLYRFLGNYTLALETAQQGLELLLTLKEPEQIAGAQINLGITYFETGLIDRALESFQSALANNQSAPKADGEQKAQILNNIGLVQLQKGNLAAAIEACQQSLELRKIEGNPNRVSRTKRHLAMIHLAQSNYDQALRLAEEIAQQGAQKAPEDYWIARTIAGQALQKQNRPAQSQQAFEDAIRVIETLRTQAAITAEIKQQFFENKVMPYLAMVDICAAQARHTEALSYAERTKARVLIDLIADKTNSASLNATQPLTLAEAEALIPGEKTALLEFTLTNDNAYLFVLYRPTAQSAPELRMLTLATNAKQIGDLVNRFRREVGERQIGFATTAASLYQQLLQPAREILNGKESLVIVPDGVLWELPFQALMTDKGRYLLQSHSISYAPSMTALREISKRTRATTTPSLLAFGNPSLAPNLKLPPLPTGEQQVRDSGATFGAPVSKIYLGAEASEQRFKAEASNHSIISLVTHGIFDNQRPMASRVYLTPGDKEDGVLQASEIMQLKLNAGLVVLSACETARGYVGPGEGLIGLTWAFLNAGASTVAVSQWQVREDATAQLMKNFYQRIAPSATTSTRAEALRQAALTVMKDPRYRHPFYWAGFVIVGKN